MSPLLARVITGICIFSALAAAPAHATPFDFAGGTYAWQWDAGPQTAAVLMLSGSAPISGWLLIFPADSGLGGLIELRPFSNVLPDPPPFQPGLVDQRLTVAMWAHILGTQQGEGPFSGPQIARVRLHPVEGQWALDQPEPVLDSAPEPATLALLGLSAVVAGWAARRRMR